MLALKCLLMLLAAGFFSTAAGILIHDIYAARQLRLLLAQNNAEGSRALETASGTRHLIARLRWRFARVNHRVA